jgi:hypothetical protein
LLAALDAIPDHGGVDQLLGPIGLPHHTLGGQTKTARQGDLADQIIPGEPF